jgi:hypothetical protein
MVKRQRGAEQIVLAAEMVIERALGDTGACGDRIHAYAHVPLSVKQLIGRLQNSFLCTSSWIGHRGPCGILTSEYGRRACGV